MLVNMAIFDAFGAGFEYAASAFVKANNDGLRYRQHPKWKGPPGRYTDDTQMAIAIAQLLLGIPVEQWTPLAVADAFVNVFKADPRKGYAGAFWDFLVKVNNGAEFLAGIRPHSEKSGGAMRAGPIGLLKDPRKVVNTAMFQASLTHATKIGMDAAAASALMVHYFYHRVGPRKELGRWLDKRVPGYRWDEPFAQPVKSLGWMHVKAAITAIQANDSMSALLQACVAFTGDVDTAAAIAGAAAHWADDIDKDLSPTLIHELENGDYGYEFLVSLDSDLQSKFIRPDPKSSEGEPDSELDTTWHILFDD